MIGVLIVAHSDLAKELISATELIVGQTELITSVSVSPKHNVEQLRGQISQAIKKVDRGKGVLILTDMFGGTPSNISLSFLEEEKVEVVTGVNLPMMVKAATSRNNEKSLKDLARYIAGYGRESIYLASELLQSKNTKR
mgnify:CR=1 FL=1